MPARTILYPYEYGSMMGGSQHSVLDLLARLDRTQYRAAVLCPPAGDFKLRAAERGAEVELVGSGEAGVVDSRRPAVSIATMVRVTHALARAIRRCDAALTHANNIGAFLCSSMAAALIGRKIPVIWTDRGFGQYPPVLRRAVRALMRGPRNHLVATTAMCAALWTQEGVSGEKLRVIHNGIDTQKFFPRDAEAAKAQLGVAPGTPTVGMVARFSRYKGHDVLIKAVARLNRQIPNVKALIIGDIGWPADDRVYREDLKVLTKDLGLEHNIVWVGGVPNDRVADAIAACDVVVNPSPLEPFGRVIAEAMLVGRPVVATRAGGAPELIAEGANGYLFEPGDSAELAARLETLLPDKAACIEMGQRAANDARTRFDAAVTAARYQELYARLLQE
jgi:glycosyltransferase involved in cell wall biosynthesis